MPLEEINKVFGNKLRVRVSGICIKDDAILLIEHKSIGESGILWAPPGGGMNFGENAHSTLIREFEEETGLIISVGKLLWVNEYLENPLHAIELFFEVNIVRGNLNLGIDPELDAKKQILTKIEFVPIKNLKDFKKGTLHGNLVDIQSVEDIYKLSGYLRS
jgi:8-oxo-dGTP diphosphatase